MRRIFGQFHYSFVTEMTLSPGHIGAGTTVATINIARNVTQLAV
jgi:hypothetical protein